MRVYAYFNAAVKIIEQYDGKIPLHHYLKQYFSGNKKHGSRDRKNIAHACYCYYRTGRSLGLWPRPEQLKAAIFLCNQQPGDWQPLYTEPWLTAWDTELTARIDFITSLYPSFHLEDIFGFTAEITKGMDIRAFATAHLVQPHLFIRIRPGFEEQVTDSLRKQNIAFALPAPDCLELPNATNTEQLFTPNKEAVIQDYSSQQTRHLMQMVPHTGSKPLSVWDCCAASGGKSILASDVLGNMALTVTDIRASIIHNLRKRFQEAGITGYEAFVADLAKPIAANTQLGEKKFGLIMCDAPCTGSGTWGRTPEQLSFFNEQKIDDYATLQKKIVGNAVSQLATGGYFLYITCSVFDKENEQVVLFMQAECHLILLRAELLKGYDKRADSMYAALFINAR